jgi:hypothetical protein
MSMQSMAHPMPLDIEAPLSPHHPNAGSVETWLHIVLDSLTEAYAALAIYRRQVQRGVAPGTAIRVAFEPQYGRPRCDCAVPGTTSGGA